MTKRAAIIITDADLLMVGEWDTSRVKHLGSSNVKPSEQLLADLRRVVARAVQRVEDCELILKEKLPEDWQAIARVRALLPKEDDHE